MYRPHPVKDVRVITFGVEGCLYLTGKSGNRRRGPRDHDPGGVWILGAGVVTVCIIPLLLHKRTFGDLHRC